jgi:copper(I)-binding protein
LAVTVASAGDYKAGSLDISDPWSRATPKGSSVAAGYMKIRNNGSTPDRLIGGSSDVASKFEVHEMKMEDGVAKMRPVKGGLEIKPGETVELKPGSFHVMFVGLKQPLSAGDGLFPGFTRGPLYLQRPRASPVQYVPKRRNGQKMADRGF